MVASTIREADVERIVKELAPDVVRIRFHEGFDWADEPVIFFRVVLSDQAARKERLHEVASRVEEKLYERLGLTSDRFPLIRFRSASEQADLKTPLWE